MTLNANRRKGTVTFIAALLYLFTECLTQYMTEKLESFKRDNQESTKCLQINMIKIWK